MKPKRKKLLYNVILLFSAFILINISSCKDGSDENEDEIIQDSAATLNLQTEIIYSMPAPSDIASMLIDDPSLDFNPELLNSIDNSEKYTNNMSRALNLGIYTADLAYASFYEQNQISKSYFVVTKEMAQELGVANSLDEKHLKMLSESKLDKKLLMRIINESFMNTDAYLTENGRQEVMTIIILGGWIEAEYIATAFTNGSADFKPDLTQRILDQGISVELMHKIFENVKEGNKLFELKGDIDKIKVVYDKLNENLSDANLSELCELIKTIRNKYIS